MQVKIKILDQRATEMTYGTVYSAGADLYNLKGESVTVPAHKTVLIHTGIALEIPEGYAAFSWLDPLMISPSSSSTAAPTLKLEYGAYEVAIAAIAASASFLS